MSREGKGVPSGGQSVGFPPVPVNKQVVHILPECRLFPIFV